jgi:hypothetical protein
MRKEKVIKIFHAQGWSNYSNWVPERKIVRTIREADLVWFEGGDDVSPSFYGQKKHRTTQNNLQRDIVEQKMFNEARELGIKCIGSCRGSQFLTVMSGGVLIQHQENPYYLHNIHTYDGKEIEVTSTHHQAAYPFLLPKEDYKILGWTNGISDFHKGGNDEELAPEKECEIVYYPKTKCLAIQSHPESLDADHPSIPYFQNLLDKFLNDEL